MAVKEIKDMGASVLTRLKKQAKETGINYQTCLQLFAQEEFLRKSEFFDTEEVGISFYQCVLRTDEAKH